MYALILKNYIHYNCLLINSLKMPLNLSNALNLLQTKMNKEFKIHPFLSPEDHEFVETLFCLIIQKLKNTIKVSEKNTLWFSSELDNADDFNYPFKDESD